MSELGAAWGAESASDRVWPGGRPPTSSPPSAAPAKSSKKKTAASKELAAKHRETEKERKRAAQEKQAAEKQREAASLPEPEPEPELDRLEGMATEQIFAELVSRGLVDAADKKNLPSEEDQRAMLRGCYDDEAARAYAARLVAVELPARAYAESRNRLIGRMIFEKAASEALKHGQNEAEIALTRPCAPPLYEQWAADEDTEPARLDTMARWCVPVRTTRRITGPCAMRAMTPSDVKARKERVAAEAEKATRLANGRKGAKQASSLAPQPGPRQRRAAAAANPTRPPRRSAKRTRGPAWKPTHGNAGTGFELQIGAGLCTEGLGMVRPSTAPDASRLTACVLDRRLRNKARRLRVSPDGLHRPATAPPSSVARTFSPTADVPPLASVGLGQPARDGSRRGSGDSSFAEVMVIEEDGHGVISDIESPRAAHTSSIHTDYHHSSAWLDGAELAAINGTSGKMDEYLQRMKDSLTAQLAAATEHELSKEQQGAMQHALAGLVALEHQLLTHGAVQHDAARPASPDSNAAIAHEDGTETLPQTQPLRRRSVDEEPSEDKFEKHTGRLLELSAASEGKAVRSHVLRDCDARIATLEVERSELQQRLRVVKLDSTQGRAEAEQLQQMLAVKEQENTQLLQHKLTLESQVYEQGVLTTAQQRQIDAIKKQMDLEMAHAALMLEAYEAHARRMSGDLTETKHNLGQARQQLAVAKGFAKQLESRTAAVTYKLRQAERRRTEAETALAQLQRQLNNSPEPVSHSASASSSESESKKSVRDAVAEMGRRRMEQQLQVAQHMLEVQRQEMEELKKLKKEWQRTSSNEYAPDGTRLGQVTFSLCASLCVCVCLCVFVCG